MTASAANISEAAMRYAQALHALAEEQGQEDAVGADLDALSEALAASEELKRFIKSPLHDAAAQERGMTAILDKLGSGELTRRLVLLLIRNRRLALLPEVIAAWRAIVAKKKGEVSAVVVSAKALTAAQKKKVESALKKALGGGVSIENEVDPELIGGLVVRVGSRMIDTSIRTRLNSLKAVLKGA
ncbi:F0F1 ATP synthase subunit delta [Thermopetrobacter sp. TC1]|uniref:F0F1 ATP synthase subunit delta n=1 Tax=Thermopetrobacter sp. TC1 TaxID=1495045 RepID=UPI00056FB21F|nr:F0F1 ATP synthase subunit delta [Thermopetrobacter sp. TC1]